MQATTKKSHFEANSMGKILKKTVSEKMYAFDRKGFLVKMRPQ